MARRGEDGPREAAGAGRTERAYRTGARGRRRQAAAVAVAGPMAAAAAQRAGPRRRRRLANSQRTEPPPEEVEGRGSRVEWGVLRPADARARHRGGCPGSQSCRLVCSRHRKSNDGDSPPARFLCAGPVSGRDLLYDKRNPLNTTSNNTSLLYVRILYSAITRVLS